MGGQVLIIHLFGAGLAFGFQLFGSVFDYAAIISDTLAAFVARLQREDEQQEGGKGQDTFHGLNG